MYVCLAGPGLVVYGLDDRAGFDDMVQSADAGLVVADVLRADQSGAAGQWVFHRAIGQMVVGLAEPIDAIVGHAGRGGWC